MRGEGPSANVSLRRGWLCAGEAWLVGVSGRPEGAAAGGLQEWRSRGRGSGAGEAGGCVRERRSRGHRCGRRAPGTVQGAPGRRPCERRSARGGTRRVCAGDTGRAVRVCACARRACPAVLKDTSGRRRRSRCPGDVTARPSDNRPVPEPSADTRGGSGGGGRGDSRARAGPEEQELGARSTGSAHARLSAGPRRSGTCAAPFAASPQPPPPGQRRAGPRAPTRRRERWAP